MKAFSVTKIPKTMLKTVESEYHSLGIEPLEQLGFETDQDLENALKSLMEEVEKKT